MILARTPVGADTPLKFARSRSRLCEMPYRHKLHKHRYIRFLPSSTRLRALELKSGLEKIQNLVTLLG